MKKGKTSAYKIKCSRKTQNNSADIWERKLQQSTATLIWKKLSFTGVTMGRESATQ
jgi:hypothetical protein